MSSTFDGLSVDEFPIFTAHFASSDDQGDTFTDVQLVTFLSWAEDCRTFDPSFCQPGADPERQRVLGDYMQMKTVESCFYGCSLEANGVPFGRPFANHDPIFFRVCVGAADLAITKTGSQTR